MKVKCNIVVRNGEDKERLLEIEPERLKDIKLPENCIMAIDGSTTRTGVSIIGKSGSLYIVMSITRSGDETPIEYKVEIKKFIGDLLLRNSEINTIVYEEPFIEYVSAAKNLLMLRTFVEELIVENKPHLDYIRYIEVNNKRWKSVFLSPAPCPNDSKLEKQKVREKLLGLLPYLKDISQDEVDATALGIVAVSKMGQGKFEELLTKKKQRPFQYNIKFFGADSDDEAFEDLSELLDDFEVPQGVLKNGITFAELGGRENFDNKVFELMDGQDKLLVLKFNSNHYGNIILKHKVGDIASQYNWIYAVIWRKSRKK